MNQHTQIHILLLKWHPRNGGCLQHTILCLNVTNPSLSMSFKKCKIRKLLKRRSSFVFTKME